ncbi:unnamed protein product [Closterium sp. NIES-64]|nr:unnamed protein product [Closterium sp. NIES-64]
MLGGRVFVRRHRSPYFAINPGGFNRHATTPAPPAHTAHGPGNQVTGPGSGRSNGLNSGTLSEAGVVEADWESAEMWRVVEESDAIHAIWTRTHVAQVIVAAHVTGANTVAGVTVSDVPAEPAAEADDLTSANSSRATYSVLCSLDPNHSLLVFNNLRRRWPSLSAPTQPPITVGSPAAQAQASGSVPVAAARESMQLMYGDSIEGPSGWAMDAPVALPGNGRLHHVLSMHPAV